MKRVVCFFVSRLRLRGRLTPPRAGWYGPNGGGFGGAVVGLGGRPAGGVGGPRPVDGELNVVTTRHDPI